MRTSWIASSAAFCLGAAGLIVAVTAGPSQSASQPQAGAPIPIVSTSPFGAATSNSPVQGRKLAPLARHGKSHAVKVGAVDGCQHAYGTPQQCVPTTLTAAHACSYLTRGGYFTKPLLVHRDPLRLMEKNGVRMTMGKTPTVSACVD